MNSRTLIYLAAAAFTGGGGWLLMQSAPEAPVVLRAGPPVQSGAPSQARWLAAGPGTAPASWADPRASARVGNGPAYGRNGRAINLNGLGVAEFIAVRIAAARSGDVNAAYDVYQAASICAATEDPVANFGDPAQREQFLQERVDMVKLCAGMTPAQIQERLGFLASAARAGNLGAQIDFYMEGPYGRALDMEQYAADPTVAQWKQDALGYLKDAGGKCDHFALALLSNAYDAGQLTERDVRTSMAYSIAAAVSRNKHLTEVQLRERFGDELAPPDFSAAMQEGAQLAAQACGAR